MAVDVFGTLTDFCGQKSRTSGSVGRVAVMNTHNGPLTKQKAIDICGPKTAYDIEGWVTVSTEAIGLKPKGLGC